MIVAEKVVRKVHVMRALTACVHTSVCLCMVLSLRGVCVCVCVCMCVCAGVGAGVRASTCPPRASCRVSGVTFQNPGTLAAFSKLFLDRFPFVQNRGVCGRALCQHVTSIVRMGYVVRPCTKEMCRFCDTRVPAVLSGNMTKPFNVVHCL